MLGAEDEEFVEIELPELEMGSPEAEQQARASKILFKVCFFPLLLPYFD